MTKVVAWLALGFSIVACIAVPVYMQQQTQAAIDRALRQRESQLMQRYLPLINELADNSADAAALKQARTLEQLFDGLARIVRAELAKHPNDVAAVNRIAAEQVAMIRGATSGHEPAGDSERDQSARRILTGEPNGNQPVGTAAARPASEGSAVAIPNDDAQVLGRIEFLAKTEDKPEVFMINADGSELRQLTHNDLTESTLTWEPFGNSITYTAQENGVNRIFSMDVAQSEPRVLLNQSQPSRLNGIAWSPDGTQMAFTTVDKDIILADVTGIERRTLIRDAENPSWAPDGQHLVFIRHHRLAIVNASGSGFEYLQAEMDFGYRPISFGSTPQWSPDGSRILFNVTNTEISEQSIREVPGIAVMNVSDRKSERIIKGAALEWALDWSPDGKFILLASCDDVGNDWMISTSRADGSHRRIVTGKRPAGLWATWAAFPDEVTVRAGGRRR